MDKLKEDILNIFTKELSQSDFNSFILSNSTLEFKLNDIVSSILQKIDLDQYLTSLQTENSNQTDENIFDAVELPSDKSSEIDLGSYYEDDYIPQQKQNGKIPSNFQLTYDMREYAKLKYITDIDNVFEEFKLHYKSEGTIKDDWEATWQLWVQRQPKFNTHIKKYPLDPEMKLTDDMIKFAKKYIDKDNIDIEFTKFKNHYISSGVEKVSWEKVWENWCLNHKSFKPKEQTKEQKEKQTYKWNFKKAQEVSNKIKDWLEFEKNINWLEDYYLKDIPIPGIGWHEVMHPDFNKEEILLFKINSEDGKFILKQNDPNIIDTEVLND